MLEKYFFARDGKELWVASVSCQSAVWAQGTEFWHSHMTLVEDPKLQVTVQFIF